ncbi:MAG TPA: hypothetical protein PKA90_12215 [Ignavibacteria bacterium]|nr:hypothetical protein [Ignavibacteria bacterium]HMR41185.1 hypothetical protein [Ignavibacteria bacterium]
MKKEKNISGISENLSDSIKKQKSTEGKQSNKSILKGKRVAISVSESEEIEHLGLSEEHLKDISIEIARYLIVNGAKLLYGGDLRQGGYTELFSELSYQYKYLNDKENKIVNYFPFPTSKSLTTDVKANFMKNQVEVKILKIPKELGKINSKKIFKTFESVDDRFVIAECLTDMRIKMANDSHARIVLGGRQKGFDGYYPGIVEETYHSLKIGKAVYLLGGFGGVAKSIIDIILGKKPNQLTNEFQYNTDIQKKFRNFAFKKSKINIDYDFMFNFFKNHSIEDISNENGLSVDENRILFESTNIHELVFLIIKGLLKIQE